MRNRRETMATGASSGGTTLISSETTVKGDITFTGQLDVEGTVVGSIQAGSGDAVYRGQFSVAVRGKGPGEPVLSALGEVDSTTSSGVFPIRFRYLQELQVVISLPEAFLPETIESVVTLTGPVRRTLRRSDRWQDLVNSGLDPQL